MKAILESGNEYVCQLKGNQAKLLASMQTLYQAEAPLDCACLTQKGHGRKTQWQVYTYPVQDGIVRQEWPGIERLIVIDKTCMRKGEIRQSRSFRISSVKHLSAQAFGEGICGHWGIENKNHWVRDTILREDRNQIAGHQAAVSMAIFNNIVINFLRRHIHSSVQYGRIIFGQNVKELLPTMRT